MTRLNRIGPAWADPRRIKSSSASPAEPGRSACRDRLGYPGSDREGQNRADSGDLLKVDQK
ncbi:hypothetical protein Taro_004821 [Colocasia esculenta]|uniref:Uncharacterized protein n=1 Tax=Colocasia esculenta TaxID=4460 RepID=A0A843TR73_COLES|nr:hypothetical protein [Colocasia esculenta]